MGENETFTEADKVRRENQHCFQQQPPNRHIETTACLALASPDKKKAPLFNNLLNSETAGNEVTDGMKVIQNYSKPAIFYFYFVKILQVINLPRL